MIESKPPVSSTIVTHSTRPACDDETTAAVCEEIPTMRDYHFIKMDGYPGTVAGLEEDYNKRRNITVTPSRSQSGVVGVSHD